MCQILKKFQIYQEVHVLGAFRIGAFLMMGFGAILLILGLILSTLGLSTGIYFSAFGLAILLVALIVLVVATDGITKYPPGDILSG
jgi:phosphoglycerol transferase MdoB-like AlkP superfamily enzyme